MLLKINRSNFINFLLSCLPAESAWAKSTFDYTNKSQTTLNRTEVNQNKPRLYIKLYTNVDKPGEKIAKTGITPLFY